MLYVKSTLFFGKLCEEEGRSASEAAWNPNGCLPTWWCELLDKPRVELLEFFGRELKLPRDDTQLGIGWCFNGVPP